MRWLREKYRNITIFGSVSRCRSAREARRRGVLRPRTRRGDVAVEHRQQLRHARGVAPRVLRRGEVKGVMAHHVSGPGLNVGPVSRSNSGNNVSVKAMSFAVGERVYYFAGDCRSNANPARWSAA